MKALDMITHHDFSRFIPHYTGKRVLVTGGAGFIGSHLVDKLVSAGALVTVFDNFSTGSLNNLAHHGDHITIINNTITEAAAIKAAAVGMDYIFHLAALVSVPESVAAPGRYHDINVTGTLNVLEAARTAGVTRILVASSSAVYGDQQDILTETSPCKPTSPYGLSKLMNEQYAKLYADLYGMTTVCTRYFNVYGPRQNPNGAYAAVIAKFRSAMQQGDVITIYGDGNQSRDFISVEHVAFINMLLASAPAELVKGQVFNVATGVSKTINNLYAELLEEFPTYSHAPIFAAIRAGDIYISRANISKLTQILSIADCAQKPTL